MAPLLNMGLNVLISPKSEECANVLLHSDLILVDLGYALEKCQGDVWVNISFFCLKLKKCIHRFGHTSLSPPHGVVRNLMEQICFT